MAKCSAMRAAATLAVTAYCVVALAVDWQRALPPVLVLAVVALYFATRPYRMWVSLWRQWEGCRQAGAGSRMTPRSRVAAAVSTVAFHLVVVACLGADTPDRWLPVLGLGLLVGGCYLGSRARRMVRWRPVVAGLALHFWLAVLMLRTAIGVGAVRWAACQAEQLLAHAAVGGRFVFGDLVLSVWAFKVLPVTMFFASLCSVLLHVGVLQVVFGELGGALSALLGISRAEAVCAVANIFLGQTEAPLLVRPILNQLSASQLHCVMVSGFASVAGSTLAAYILMGVPATHLLTATVLNAPAAIAIAKLLHPDNTDTAAPIGRVAPSSGSSGGPWHARAAHARAQKRSAATAAAALIRADCSPDRPPPHRPHPPRRPSAAGLPREVALAGALDAADEGGCDDAEMATAEARGAALGVASTDGDAAAVAIELGSAGAPEEMGLPEPVRMEGDDATRRSSEASAVEGETAEGTATGQLLPVAQTDNLVQAATEGAINAVPLVACIAATMICFLALIALLDSAVGFLGSLVGVQSLSFTRAVANCDRTAHPLSRSLARLLNPSQPSVHARVCLF